MKNEETNKKPMEQDPSSNPEQKEDTVSVETILSELKHLKLNVQKRRGEITTLKILFYTGIAVLLFGFFYTSQTLQRAQTQNIKFNIDLFQNRVSHTMLMLESKLHKRIQFLEERVSDLPGPDLHQILKNMIQSLNKLEPETTSMRILIEKVQRNSKELSQMLAEIEDQGKFIPTPLP